MPDKLGRAKRKRSANWDSTPNKVWKKQRCDAQAAQARADETSKVLKRSSVLSSRAKLGVVNAYRKLTIAQKESALTEAARLRALGTVSLKAIANRTKLHPSMITRLVHPQ